MNSRLVAVDVTGSACAASKPFSPDDHASQAEGKSRSMLLLPCCRSSTPRPIGQDTESSPSLVDETVSHVPPRSSRPLKGDSLEPAGSKVELPKFTFAPMQVSAEEETSPEASDHCFGRLVLRASVSRRSAEAIVLAMVTILSSSRESST